MSSAGASSNVERDLRLDFFRGLALFCIFIDHIPNNILAEFTLQSLMFADAAEVFILVSGYAAGMAYSRYMKRQGFLITGVRIYHRVWQLYVAHVFLFMIFMATVAYAVDTLNNSLYVEEFGAANFLNEPGVAVVKALMLQFQPAFMDILPLYIVLLAFLPVVLVAFRFWPRAVVFASLALWVAVQFDRHIAPSAYPGPDRLWYFNPFAWQALFFLGARFGSHSGQDVSWRDRRWLLYVAAAFALTSFLIRFNWTLHDFYDSLPVVIGGEPLWPFLSKQDLGLFRFLNVLALAFLVARLIHPQARFLAGRAARPFVICGRNSLHIFCLGILLSVVGELLLNEFFGGLPIQVAVSVAGIAIMIGVATLMEWFATAQDGSRNRALVGPVAGKGA